MWYAPTTLKEALNTLQRPEVTVIAGGTDLMVQKRIHRGVAPNLGTHTLSLHNIAELRGVRVSEYAIEIGTATPLADLAKSLDIPEILRSGVGSIAAPATRNIATIGGNVCNGSPAADSLPSLYTLGATLVISSVEGTRELPIEDFLTGPRKNVLQKGELLVAIRIPNISQRKGYFCKVGTRKANALTKVSFAGVWEVENSRVTYCSFAFGSVGPTIVHVPSHSHPFVGCTLEQVQQARGEVVASIMDTITPIDDQRSTAAYRKQVAENLMNQCITEYIG